MGQEKIQRNRDWDKERGGRLVILGVVAFGVVEIVNGLGVVRHPLGRFGLALGCGWGIERVMTGREAQRKNNRYLNRLLAQAGESYQALKQEAQEFEVYANHENQRLEAANCSLEKENRKLVEARDDLQVEVWELEEQVEQLTTWQKHESGGVEDGDSGHERDGVDLSGVEIAIVGGHGSMRRSVMEELRAKYGLGHGVEIPTLWEARATQQQLRAQLDRCDLIAIVTGYMSHPLTNMIMDLKRTGVLRGQVVLVQVRGKTGVLREILDFFSKNKLTA